MYKVMVAGEDVEEIFFPSLSIMLYWMMRYRDEEPVNFLVEELNMKAPDTIESVSVNRAKEEIEEDLSIYAPLVKVVGSRMLEDGYELVLEGPGNQVDEIITHWTVPYVPY